MSTAAQIARILVREGVNARVHYQVWWALRNRAIPKYLDVMNDYDYVDFFHAANAGHFTLFLLSLGKIFDPDTRTASIKVIKRELLAEGKLTTSDELERLLKPYTEHVSKVLSIRNQSVAHNEHAVSAEEVFEKNDVTPNQIRDLIDVACTAINIAARALEIDERIFDNDRYETATLHMIEVLAIGLNTKHEHFDS